MSEIAATGQRALLTPETRLWLARAQELQHHSAADNLAEDRVARLTISDQLFREFGSRPREDVTTTVHSVGPNRIQVLTIRPFAQSSGAPGYVYFHGGAFWHGSAQEEVNVGLMAERAHRTGMTVFAVEYRLAPEHPYPAAVEDGEETLRWIHRNARELNVDASRVVLGGISAGGNIAAAIAGEDRHGLDLAGLLLEVPAVDLRDDGYWSPQYAALNGLNSPAEMVSLYTSDYRADDPGISPVLSERLALFPRTHIMTAEIDPLGAGGEALACRLRGAGVAVTGTRHLGALHGSIGLTARDPIALAWQDEVCNVLARLAAPRSADAAGEAP